MPVKSKRTIDDYYPFLNEGDKPFEIKQQGYKIGDVSASGNSFIFTAPSDIEVLKVKLVVDTTISTDETNFWEAQIKNLTVNRDLLASADTMNKLADLTADAVKTLTPDQNVELTDGDVLELQLTKNASADNLSGLYVEIEYVVSGEATTTSSSTSSSTSTSTSTSTTTTSSSSSTTTTAT